MANIGKFIIIGAAVAAVGLIGFGQISQMSSKDPEITGIQAKFVGEIGPGEGFRKSMFEVTGVTSAGKLVKLNDFTSETSNAAENGATCELDIVAQDCSTTVIVDITREVVFTKNIGYPEEEDVVVTGYSNGDLEFTGSGEITNFTDTFPWNDFDFSHVYIDETLDIEDMDYWFENNKQLVYCDDLPKTLKTAKNTFSGCTALEKTPDYFQCSSLKIMDYMFSGCTELKEADVIPVNTSSVKYCFSDCTSLQKPVTFEKTSNLIDVSGVYNGCIALRETTAIPESVIYANEIYRNCINIKDPVRFPMNVQYIASAYEGAKGLTTAATIPESVVDYTNCYNGCSSLSGNLEINSDANNFDGVLIGATTNGDKLTISGNCGNLLAIQKEANNTNISLADPEAASQQNLRLQREQEGQS